SATGRIRDLCSPRIEGAVHLRLDDLAAALGLAFPGAVNGVSGSLSADAAVDVAPGKPHVHAELRVKGSRIGNFSPGEALARLDATPARIRVETLEVPLGRGHVAATGEIALGQGFPLVADAQLRDVDLPELLRRLGVPHAWVALRTSGRISVKGPLSPLSLG